LADSFKVVAMFLSSLELRHLIEQSFLPTRCECRVEPPAALSVRFYQDSSNQEILVVTGIALGPLNSSHAIASLIADLRYDLESVNSVTRYPIYHS